MKLSFICSHQYPQLRPLTFQDLAVLPSTTKPLQKKSTVCVQLLLHLCTSHSNYSNICSVFIEALSLNEEEEEKGAGVEEEEAANAEEEEGAGAEEEEGAGVE